MTFPDTARFRRIRAWITLPRPVEGQRVVFQGRKRHSHVRAGQSADTWYPLMLRDKNRKDKYSATVGGKYEYSLTEWRSVRFVLQTSSSTETASGVIKGEFIGDGGLPTPQLTPFTPTPKPTRTTPTTTPTPPPPVEDSGCACSCRCSCEPSFRDFGHTMTAAPGAAWEYVNDLGHNSIVFKIAPVETAEGSPPTILRAAIEGSIDGTTWDGNTLRSMDSNTYTSNARSGERYVGSISGLRKLRLRVTSSPLTSALSTPATTFSVTGRSLAAVNTLKGIEVGPYPNYFMQVSRDTSSNVRGVTKQARGVATKTEALLNECTVSFWDGPRTLGLVSSSDEDGTAGGGAHSVVVQGLDNNWDEIEEVVELDGTAVVQTTRPFRRCNMMTVQTVGSYGGTNVGDIRAIVTKDGTDAVDPSCLDNTVAMIVLAGNGRSASSTFTVPRFHTGYLNFITMFPAGTRATTFRVYTRGNNDTVALQATVKLHEFGNIVAAFTENFKVRPRFEECTDVWVTAQLATGSQPVNVTMDLVLLKD